MSQLLAAKSFHGVQTVTFSPKAKMRLRKIKLDDIDVLYSFHIDGACRLWCIKDENLMAILWWDEHHEVYPVPKKHT